MAGAPLNPAYAPYYVSAGQKYGIPPAVLAGVADVETNGGRNIATSSTGARGLMQFEPGTAAGLGVNVNDPVSEIDGAARLLLSYGYKSNPTKAIASYNAGPGNYSAGLGYAQQVLSSAARLAPGLKGFGAASSSTPTPAGGASSTTGSSSSYGGLGGFLLKAALTVSLLAGGLVLAGAGARSTLSGRPQR